MECFQFFFGSGFSKVLIPRYQKTSLVYCETLQDYLLPFAAEKHGKDWLYQQHKTSIHNSNETKARL